MFLAGMFLKLGASERLARLLSIGLVILALIGAIWWLRADAYGDGERAADERWQEAGRKLERQAEASADRADDRAEIREAEFMEQVAEEKERIDEAERNGSSPLDALFGGGS